MCDVNNAHTQRWGSVLKLTKASDQLHSPRVPCDSAKAEQSSRCPEPYLCWDWDVEACYEKDSIRSEGSPLSSSYW